MNEQKEYLKNVVSHVSSHNKASEIEEMWRQHKSESDQRRDAADDRKKSDKRGGDQETKRSREQCDKQFSNDRRTSQHSRRDSASGGDPQHKAGHHSRHTDQLPRAHMDSPEHWTTDRHRLSARQFERMSGARPDKWTHSGYRELYPDEYNSPDEDAGTMDYGRRWTENGWGSEVDLKYKLSSYKRRQEHGTSGVKERLGPVSMERPSQELAVASQNKATKAGSDEKSRSRNVGSPERADKQSKRPSEKVSQESSHKRRRERSASRSRSRSEGRSQAANSNKSSDAAGKGEKSERHRKH